jgi:kynurenine 3-monooxygenase
MIDLAEQAGAEFSSNRKFGTLPYLKLLTLEKRKRSLEEKNTIWFWCRWCFSRIRHRMQRQSMFNYSQEFFKYWIQELNIPANPDGSHKLDKNSFHIWPRGIYVDCTINLDGSFTCTLFMPFEGENSLHCSKIEKM